ncbi:hypothetical protein E2F48_16410 [Arthrobacter crusticola]|uniref:Fis family transcriptional regulator n=1 Tax=Arthrobacter crusticola TaxID=2547960 RepID=A0A4R5TLX1_9MICC|nr:hypothetical protein [Arthrobacter crusticola]TDK23567.1 hypothetical protein E2F48_16410 [Arthrobacter crusticola]
MRWEALFGDLEAQLAAARAASDEAAATDLLRVEQARVALVDRLAGSLAQALKVRTGNGQGFSGRLAYVGAEWLVLTEGQRSVLVPFAAILSIEGLGRAVGPRPAGIHARLGLASAYRALARDRVHVSVYAGSPATVSEGTLDRVGADFLEVALVPPGEYRRAANVRAVVALPFAAVAAVASHP